MFTPSPDWNLHHFYPAAGEGPPAASSGQKTPAAATGALTATNASNGTQLSPKSSLSKTVRKRSRASRKSPTTLLNANTTNFRALVQKFTGCPTNNPLSSFPQKGPLNLNFKAQQDHCDQTYSYKSSSSSSSSVLVAPIAHKIYDHHHHHHHSNNNYLQYSLEAPSPTIHDQQPQFMYSPLDQVGSENGYLHDQLLGVDACNFSMSENRVNDGYFW